MGAKRPYHDHFVPGLKKRADSQDIEKLKYDKTKKNSTSA